MKKLQQFQKSIKHAKSPLKTKPFKIVYDDEPCDAFKFQEIRVTFV